MGTAYIGGLHVDLLAGAAKFAEDMNKAADNVAKFGQRVQAIGRNISSVGRSMSTYLTAPLAGFAALSLRTAGDFEQSMNRVAAVSGATGEELASLNELAKQLGIETRYSASEAADAMSFLAMAGMRTDDIIGAMPDTLLLAAAAQLDMADAADIVTNILAGYNMETEQLTHAVDVLTKAFTSSNTDLLQLGEAMKYAGPVASAAGVQFEEAAAALGMMGNAGIQASMAGTSLRGAITRMLSPTGKVADIIEELGLRFTDAQGRLLPLADIIEQLEPHAEDAGLFMELFGQRAGPAMAALVSQGAGALRDLTGELENSAGTAAEISEVQMQGLNGALTQLRSAFEGLQIAIADSGLLEWATKAVQKVTEWVRAMAETNPATMRWITIIGALVAALGPVVLVLGGVVTGIGKLISAFALVMKIGPLFINVARGIGLAITAMGGPISIVVAAIAALALAWITHGDEIRAFIAGWVQRIDELMGGRLSAIIDGARAVFTFFVEQVQLLGRLLMQVLTGDFSGAWETFRELWANSWNALVGIVSTVVESITGWIRDRLGAVFDWLGEKIGWVADKFRWLYDVVVGHSYMPDMVDGIIEEMQRLEDGFVAPAEDMTQAVGDSFQSLGERAKGIFQELVQTGSVSLQSVIGFVAQAVEQLFGLQGMFGGAGLTGAVGSIMGAVAGIPGLEKGGLAMAHRPVIVGERRAEIFRPHTTGTVEPEAGGAGNVTQVFHVSTPDANSFRRSERQILRGARMRLQMA